MSVFDLSHHKSTVGAAYTFYRTQFIEHKILVMFHVPGVYFQDIVRSYHAVSSFCSKTILQRFTTVPVPYLLYLFNTPSIPQPYCIFTL